MMLAEALEYAEFGWHIFPIRAGGKEPLTAHGLKDATLEPEQIQAWWGKWPTANIGIRTGQISDLVVVDIDADHGGDGSIARLEAEHDTLATVEAETGGGGSHLYFRYPEGKSIRNSAGKLGYGIDVRGNDGYVVAPPSLHKSGRRYRWCDAYAGPLPLPTWLLDQLVVATPPAPKVRPKRQPLPFVPKKRGYVGKAAAEEIRLVADCPEGRRHKQLATSAFRVGQLAHLGDDEDALIEALAQAALHAGLPETDARRTAAECFKAGKDAPREPRRGGGE